MAAIPGMQPGWYTQDQLPQNVYLNTPRNNGMAGRPQYYDPQYATQRQAPQVNTQLNGKLMAPGSYKGVKPGGGSGATGSNRGSTQTGYGQPAGQGGFNIQTGITAGPAVPQAQVQATQQRLQNYQAPSPGAQYAPFMQHLNSLVGGALGTASTDFGRDAAFANAQHLLASQKAQAGAGTAWGGAMLGDYASRMGTQSQGLNALLSLLQSFMV